MQLTSSHVSFGTAAEPNLYTGAVTALDGTTLQARLTDSSGAASTLSLAAAISGTRLGGTLHVTASG